MMRKYLNGYNAMGEDEETIAASPEKKRFASVNPSNEDTPFYDNQFNDFETDYVESDSDKAEKIFDGSPHSKQDYVMAISMLARKIKLSDRDLDSILSFINFFMPASNKCPSDIRTLKEYLNKDMKAHGSPQKIYHCIKCSKQQKCCNCKTPDIKCSFFQTFNIVHQLKPLIKKYSVVREKYGKHCRDQEDGIYIDALTGSARKKYDDDVLCLSMYTDGIKIRKSSSNELWVLGATWLDLPIKIRSSQNNFIMLLAWYGPSKPLWSEVSDLINDQLSSVIEIDGKFLQIAILQVNADMPARASLLNCMQSGYCPCLRCNVKGIRVEGNMQYQQFENITATTRSYLDDIKKVQSLKKDKNVTEVCPKGPAAFTKLFIPECVTSDVMHTVYYGPTHDDLKHILKNKCLIQLFDSVIDTILWPSELSNRKLRYISEINLYKASEWKTLILYVTVPVLLKFLSNSPHIDDILKKQCQNILQGISALILLMKDTVSEFDISKSEELLKKWFESRKSIYPHNPYTPKVHEFTHFPEQVRIHGPLQASSCFAGENILNKISNMITSNHGDVILKQIAERTLQEINISEWKSQQKEGPFKELILTLDGKSNKVDQYLPLDSKLAQETGATLCFKMAKIKDYEFRSSHLCENERNSYCLFNNQDSLRFGCIEYITEVNKEILIQIQPYYCEPLNNFQDTEFNDYFTIGKKMSDPIICNGNVIYKKGIVVTQNSIHMFVPLTHVYEHN